MNSCFENENQCIIKNRSGMHKNYNMGGGGLLNTYFLVNVE